MWRQAFTLGLALAFWLLVWCVAANVCALLQRGELGLQAGLVSRTGLLEQRALLGVHAFGLGAVLPGLEPGQFERDALDLGVAPLDALGLRVDALALLADVFALLTDVGQHLRGHPGQIGGPKRQQVLGF